MGGYMHTCKYVALLYLQVMGRCTCTCMYILVYAHCSISRWWEGVCMYIHVYTSTCIWHCSISRWCTYILVHSTALSPGDGKVYVWDVSGRQCVHCFTDEGCVVGDRVGVSPDGHYVACGSDSGVVNIYSQEECLGRETPKPLKAVMNLTTAVDHLHFNSTRYTV